MANVKKAFLEKVREKVIKHEINKIKKDIIDAYGRSDFNDVTALTNRLIELQNKELDRVNTKMDQKISNAEAQLDAAFDVTNDFDQQLGLDITPSQKNMIQTAMKSEPLSNEDDLEAERILQEIMQRSERKM